MVVMLTVLVLVLFAVAVLIAMYVGERRYETQYGLSKSSGGGAAGGAPQRNVSSISSRMENHGAGRVRK